MAVAAHVLFAFADRGGTITTVLTWSPDPDEVAKALVRAAGVLEDFGPPLRAAARVTKFDIQERFDTETDPEGDPWVPLNADYLTYKTSIGGDPRILHLWGPLETAATSFSRFKVDAKSGDMYYNATGLPFYWEFHQNGTLDEFAAETLRIIKEIARKDPEAAARARKDATTKGSGRGKNIPARPFIGVSGEAEELIFNLFDLWVADSTQLKVSSVGVMQHAPGGRFGSPVDFSNR
jgi:hypothetical protein